MRLVPLLLLAGCGLLPGERFSIRDVSCDADFTRWTGGLTHHLLQGPGDGTFDYDPQGDVMRRLWGSYDLHTGDFDWDVEYVPSHYNVRTEVTGYGYANPNGDLDVAYTSTTTDVNDETFVRDVREERVACDVTRRTTYTGSSGPVDEWQWGTYVSDGYDYESEVDGSDSLWTDEGHVNPDLTWSETTTATGPGFTYEAESTGDRGEGYSRSDWTQESDGTVFDGYDEFFRDGSRHRAYSYTDSGTLVEWDYTVDYDGNGTGTYDAGSFHCDITFEEWECTAECSDGNTYDC